MSQHYGYDHLRGANYSTPVPPLVILSQAEMVARIEEARLAESDPVCPTCGCSAGIAAGSIKCCPQCSRHLSILCFPKNKSRPDGRGGWCLTCCATANSAYRARKAIAAIRRAS